ncbi:molybdopterin molybdenumtransferase MoeA [Microtetraspora sp. NBRC 13810]|uniref:molybdopterin molybdotransferase MoeA n=1 Tax=Microtetraspora sp. NBRC 13810 TaxID=3030990 RepID=UPI0024A2A958|nr:molybdopterin molybdotransferase MoeA [Microtetraspora sp. NBRC 13810]GLW05072.1 molybdopterin molybdenumtransferase MoeA [Microtetraspora sp. NBRC 13810]
MTLVRAVDDGPQILSTATPWEVARWTAWRAATPLPPAETSLREAAGLRLAAPLRSLVALPGFDTAAMDGYAVAGRPPWQVVGGVLAGRERYDRLLEPGSAVEIATGAEVPLGTEAVLPIEESARLGDMVAGEIAPGRHIRRRGEDCPEGHHIVAAGARVTPALLGLAASLGHDTLTVHPLPRVTALVTGDEVVPFGLPGRGRVRDAIGPMLPGLVSWAGGSLGGALRVGDTADALTRAIAGSDADVVAVCGASSVGPADHLRAVLAELGAKVLVAGVACRPGHPQVLARLPDGRVLVGLPGNPYAALVAAMTLLVPVLAGLEGRPFPVGSRSAIMGEVRPRPYDTRLVAVRRTERGAAPVGHDRPGTLWGAALAEALAVVPPGWQGEPVELLDLPG